MNSLKNFVSSLSLTTRLVIAISILILTILGIQAALSIHRANLHKQEMIEDALKGKNAFMKEAQDLMVDLLKQALIISSMPGVERALAEHDRQGLMEIVEEMNQAIKANIGHPIKL
ncbi:MAG: hypothetical protein GXO58_10150, partial [Thermodesulfobacteria bacterium]|nr:hypothetical protein [Thermodesulfobacteriota bacterium]